MKKEKITVKDIADSLGLSRNTVSKALNGQYVPPRTREIVLNAAIDLGYKSYHTVASSDNGTPHRRIVLITSKMLMTNMIGHFYKSLLTSWKSPAQIYSDATGKGFRHSTTEAQKQISAAFRSTKSIPIS